MQWFFQHSAGVVGAKSLTTAQSSLCKAHHKQQQK